MKSMNGSRRNLKLFLLFNQLSTRTLMCNSSKNWALQVSTGTEGKLKVWESFGTQCSLFLRLDYYVFDGMKPATFIFRAEPMTYKRYRSSSYIGTFISLLHIAFSNKLQVKRQS